MATYNFSARPKLTMKDLEITAIDLEYRIREGVKQFEEEEPEKYAQRLKDWKQRNSYLLTLVKWVLRNGGPDILFNPAMH